MQNIKLVLIRHGESTWNKLNKFTGWTDVGLSKNGKKEAKMAGKLLKKKIFIFDRAYTSLLKRAIHTLWFILKEIDQAWLPITKTWRLNERHYGKLQGLNKEILSKKYGEKQIKKWRRNFKSIPPHMKNTDNLISCNDKRYNNLKNKNIPTSESLELTLNRILPLWNKKIIEDIKKNKKILIVAHGNSLRALIKYLSNLTDQEIKKLHIPTGTPIIYNIKNNKIDTKYSFLKND